jgi:hypothetical protein
MADQPDKNVLGNLGREGAIAGHRESEPKDGWFVSAIEGCESRPIADLFGPCHHLLTLIPCGASGKFQKFQDRSAWLRNRVSFDRIPQLSSEERVNEGAQWSGGGQ